MEDKIKVIVVPCSKKQEPYITEVNNGFEDLNKIVGGFIDSFFYTVDGVTYIIGFNEDCFRKDMLLNCSIEGNMIAGNIFIARNPECPIEDYINAGFASVEDADLKKLMGTYIKDLRYQQAN